MEENLKRKENESQTEFIERIVKGKLIDKTIDEDYTELSELVFGEGNRFNSSEVRKRFYGIKRMIELKSIENNQKMVNKINKTPINNENITYNNKNRILIFNDLHIPFQIDGILDIVKQYASDLKCIVFGGDYLDCQSISSFPELERLSLEDEIIAGIEFLKEIKNIVSDDTKIILLRGNHEYRQRTYITKMQQKEMYKFLNPNILEMLRDGFTYYEKNEQIKIEGIQDITVINTWYININNDLIVCHPSNFSRAYVKNATLAIEYFINIGEKFNTVVVAHNHRQGIIPNHLGKMAIESGCLCKTFAYVDGKTNMKPQDNGYVTCEIKDGMIDNKKIKVEYLQGETLVKKESQIKL